MCRTLIAECVNGIVNDAVGAEALRFREQAEQRGNLQPHRVIRLLEERIVIIRSLTFFRTLEILVLSTLFKKKEKKIPTTLYLVVVLQQDPDHTLHALCLHRLACKLQQVLQGIGGVGGFTEVNVESGRLTGFGQTQLFGWSFFMWNL